VTSLAVQPRFLCAILTLSMVIPGLDRIVRVDPIKTGVLRLPALACGGAALGALASGGCDERGFSPLVAHHDDASGLVPALPNVAPAVSRPRAKHKPFDVGRWLGFEQVRLANLLFGPAGGGSAPDLADFQKQIREFR